MITLDTLDMYGVSLDEAYALGFDAADAVDALRRRDALDLVGEW